MSRKLLSVIAVAVFTLSATAPAFAEPPPPPPPPPPGAPPVDDGCPSAISPPAGVKAQVASLTPKDIGLTGGKAGALTWRWGVRITTGDPRVDRIAGLELNGALGLLAVTRDGQWLAFDLQGGGLDGMHEVAVEPMRGAHGAPRGLVSEAYGDESVLFDHETSPRLYAFHHCGFEARGQLATAESVGINMDYRTSAKPVAGFHIVAASEADRFTPDYRPGVSDLYSIWRPDAGDGDTLVYEDGRAPGLNGPRELARLPHAISAMFAIYSADRRKVDLFMAADVKPGVVDIYRFSVD